MTTSNEDMQLCCGDCWCPGYNRPECNCHGSRMPHPKTNEHDAKIRADERKRVVEVLGEYSEHTQDCIRSQFSAGRPMYDGGYEQKFADKWYQAKPVDKTPKCDCGLSAAIAALQDKNKGI